MAKITKVKSAYLERLNNAEYRTFMARYGNLLAGGGGDSESPDEISFDPNDPLGIPQEVRTAFAADFALLTDAVNQSSASEETAQMSTLDKERDDLLIFITSTITQMTKSPLAAQRTAAEKLYLPVKPFRLPVQSVWKQSSKIKCFRLPYLIPDVESHRNISTRFLILLSLTNQTAPVLVLPLSAGQSQLTPEQ